MELTNFLIDLSPNEKENPQPVLAFSVSKNAFLILADFKTTETDCKEKVQITNARFKLQYLNNDLNYCTIDEVHYHEKDNKDIYAFYIHLKIGNVPEFKYTVVSKMIPDGINYPIIKKNNGEVIRFHLVFDNNTDTGAANSGDWPCNNVKIA